MKLLKLTHAALLLIAPCSALAQEGEVSFSDEQLAFFETKIRPVLAEHSYSSHSHEAERNKGGFYLDSREGILEALLAEPGDADASLLIEAVHYKNPDYQMPPAGKLADAVIADLERWVEMGLPWPAEAVPGAGEGFDLEQRKAEHWAWAPPRRAEALPIAPGLDDQANVIDRFIESRLAEQGLRPGPLADRATLIRRVTIDLTGLPPTPQEVHAFINDPQPDDIAYEKLVDGLLASPRYGEKWARHWLDLVRYAESYGHEFDYTMAHAWKYRDYVIRAINDDLPYDRFVTEHIAGDLVEPRIHPQTQVNEALVATGWWFMHEQTHSPTDVRLHEAERIDNQIDVLSKTFLGVTVACARCHDHKFDAIGDEDYYALAGYMQSSRQQEAYLDPGGRVQQQMDKVRAVVAEGQSALEAIGAQPRQPTTIPPGDSVPFEDFNDGSYDGWHAAGWAWGDRPTIPGQWDSRSAQAAAVLPGLAHSGLYGDKAVGILYSPEFDFKHKNIWVRVRGKGQIRLVIDTYTMNMFNALLFEGFKAAVDTGEEWQWAKLHDHRGLFYDTGLHRGHIMLIDDDENSSLIVDAIHFGGDKPPPHAKDALSTTVSDEADEHRRFAQLTEQLHQAAAALPRPERALAIIDGSAENSYVHIRGSYKNIGETIPRRNLQATGGLDVSPPDRGSGRDQLAGAIVDPGNPLTARVQVNRLWHHLFGRGIVPTVDNFGYLGIAPSHPALLDHLAVVFIEDDAWSNKAMTKRIVMSRAYRRASDKSDSTAEEKDPLNQLLHRQNIRRMPAEGIRDAILSVSGSLNEQMFGPSVPVHLTEFMQGRGRPKPGPLDGNGRRSIYISVRRNFLAPMMLTFDAPIPFSTVGSRNSSNVPAQALTLMNDPFVHDQADKWAQRLIKDGSESPEQRVEVMWLTAMGRSPSESERDAALGFVTQQAQLLGVSADRLLADARPWRELCHAVYNLKGFIYVR